MGFAIKKAYASVVIETTRGSVITDTTTVSNIRLNTDIKFSPEIEMAAMEWASERYSESQNVPTIKKGSVDFSYYRRPGASVGLPPHASKIDKMSGQAETITLTASGALGASNSTVVTINGTPLTAVVYATSSAVTMAAIAAAIAGVTASVQSATVSGTSILIVTAPGSEQVTISAATTGGSAVTWTTPQVAWTPVPTQDEVSASLYLYLVPVSGNMVRVIFKGASANSVLSMDKPGDPWKESVKAQAAFVSVDDNAGVLVTSTDSTVPPSTIGGSVSIASETTAQLLKLELDRGNKLDPEYNLTDSSGTGIKAFRISDRKPMLKFSVYMKLLASEAYYTRWAAGTVHSATFITPTNGTCLWKLVTPAIQIMKLNIGNADGYATWDVEAKCLESSGNDAHSVIQAAS